MSVKLPNGEISRSMPEQVGKNMRDIEELKTGYNQISNIAIVEGHLIVTLQDGTEFDTGAVKGLSSIAFDASRHLIVTYDDGTTADLGLIKGISSFSINGSQHLIATYDDGSTQDLGAIFSGNISISGNITASGTIDGGTVTGSEIIEKMSGYTFYTSSPSGYTLEYIYTGIAKTGNKVTCILAANITRTSDSADPNPGLGNFGFPASVMNKLYTTNIGGIDMLAAFKIQAFSSYNSFIDAPVNVFKSSTSTPVQILGFKGLSTLNQKYYVRIEITFLLGDNLTA